MRALRILGGVALALLCWGGAGSARAASLESVGTFNEPIYVTSDPGDANRLFVVERLGRIELAQGGTTTLFANLESAVGCGGSCSGERGLLSIALAPDFDSSGRLYLDYANDETGVIHVAEMRASGGVAPIGSLRDLLTIPHPGAANHNGGQLQFGPEGDLYVSTGDGGGGNDEFHNAQDLESRLGKILRLEPDPGGASPFYKIPAGNPFAGVAGDAPEIWSYGLRNPFRFSFDRLSGALVIGDVGQGAREEVDYAPGPLPGRKANYGWNCREGLIAGPGGDLPGAGCTTTPFVNPVFDYPHEDPGGGRAHGCAIIGGYVDQEAVPTALTGRYLYGDHCTGQIRSLDIASPFASDRSEGLTVADLSSFGEDATGRLYAVSEDGPVYRILSPPLPLPPPPRIQPLLGIRSRQLVRHGGRATITVFVSPCVRSVATSVLVSLHRGRRRLQTRHLSRVCTVNFRPRISRRSTFRAKLLEDPTYLTAESRPLTIRPRHRLPSR